MGGYQNYIEYSKHSCIMDLDKDIIVQAVSEESAECVPTIIAVFKICYPLTGNAD